jgi:hypothetical protein
MKASIHLTDINSTFPTVDTTEDQTTGINDSPKDSKAYNLRTLLMMFIVVLRAGKADVILEEIRTKYPEVRNSVMKSH